MNIRPERVHTMMGRIPASFLLCLAVSAICKASLKNETLPSHEEGDEENALTANDDEVPPLRPMEEELRTGQNASVGSTFIRWGRKTCPSNTSTVYVGVAGGKQYDQTGGGTNRLCLTMEPELDGMPEPPEHGYLFGGEYQGIGSHHQQNVPCSVCLAPQSSTIMVPGTRNCPSGWTRQYYGHLTSARHDEQATEYVCLDQSPEDVHGGQNNENGLLFYYVLTSCGSLPCPPYKHSKVVTCVVCSK